MSGSSRLREFIKAVRGAKTQAEEKQLFLKEKGAIHESFLKNEAHHRARNIAKLVFINMCGYDTDFGQMQILNLITSEDYLDKKIGYLGLTQLFCENSEVLMLATHSLRKDLESTNQYVVHLALVALSEICTSDMCNALAPLVSALLKKNSPYLRKQATLAATRIIRKSPDNAPMFADRIDMLLKQKQHGNLLAAVQLMSSLIKVEPTTKAQLQDHLDNLSLKLKKLVSHQETETEINGVNDPFLQVELLRLFKHMGVGDQKASDQMSDILANVVTNTSSKHNAGKAVLLECVKTITSVESSQTLKSLAIKVSSQLLKHNDNNGKYVSLFVLQKMTQVDLDTIIQHSQLIVDCLVVEDTSIRLLALDLIGYVVTPHNADSIVQQLIGLLQAQDKSRPDKEFQSNLTSRVLAIIDTSNVSPEWYVDNIVQVLLLSDHHNIRTLVNFIQRHPTVQPYVYSKLTATLASPSPALARQQSLAQLYAYVVGEYYSSKDESQLDNILACCETLLAKATPPTVLFLVTALAKLHTKATRLHSKILDLIRKGTGSQDLEVQSRCIETLHLLEDPEWQPHHKFLFDAMPAYVPQESVGVAKTAQEDLLDIDDFLNDQPKPEVPLVVAPSDNAKYDILDSIFNEITQQQAQPPVQAQEEIVHRVALFQDENVAVSFRIKGEQEENTEIEMGVTNHGGHEVSEVVLQCAVLKYLRLQMLPMSSNSMGPGETITQPNKPITMKLKLVYSAAGHQATLVETLSDLAAQWNGTH